MTETEVRFDAERGTLQLDRTAFDALVTYAKNRHALNASHALALHRLRAAGALGGDGNVRPMLEPALRAIANPVHRLTVHVTGEPGGGARADGWADADVAAFLIDRVGFGLAPGNPGASTPDPGPRHSPAPRSLGRGVGQADRQHPQAEPSHELLAVHPTFVPAVLARLTGLGPRSPLPAASQATALLAGVGKAEQPSVSRYEGSRATGDCAEWEVTLRSLRSPGPAAERRIRVGGFGMELLADDGHVSHWVYPAATPTDIWRGLTCLFSSEEFPPVETGT